MKYEKMSHELISLCERYRKSGRSGLKAYPHIKVSNLDKPAKKPGVAVFLRCDDQGEFSTLASKGIRVNQQKGAIRTAYLPVEELEGLSDDARIQKIVPSRKLHMCLDVALPKVHVPQFRTAQGLTGRGVVVGIVDSGIDPNHPDFAGRIHSIWDQTLDGNGVPEGSFGMELTGEDLAGSRDTVAHGTHVSGIAAGADSRFTGIAPEATIVMVKTDFGDASIADGVRYIFRVAKDLGLPAVVNLSLGGHFGGHDGADELSQMIDQMTGPGRIVCAAAGNEHEDHIHARFTVPAGRVVTLNCNVPNGATHCLLDCWYSGSERIDVSVTNPRGRTTSFQAPITSGNPQTSQTLSGMSVVVTTAGPDLANHDHQIVADISNNNNPITPGIWKLSFRGVQVTTGLVHAWVAIDGSGVFTNNVDDDFKVGSPGCASSVITVASFTTNNALTNLAGQELDFADPVDQISSFSSGGPLRNGALKPDVAAPGEIIVSARSADGVGLEDQDIIAEGFMRDQGTSMATPFVAGLVALMLQSNATLAPADVKAILKGSSRVPNGAAGAHDLRWGFGRVDAAAITIPAASPAAASASAP